MRPYSPEVGDSATQRDCDLLGAIIGTMILLGIYRAVAGGEDRGPKTGTPATR